jgi:hypothetical protein
VRWQLAADRHRGGAPADRADGDRGRAVSRLDGLQDLDDLDHDVLLVLRRRLLLGLGVVRERVLGHVGFVRRDVGKRCNRLERNQRFALDRRVRPDRRGRDP